MIHPMKRRSLLCLLLTCLVPLTALMASQSTVTVASTSTAVLAADGTRDWVIISLPSTASAAVFVGIGGSSVTTSNGHEIQPGGSLTLSSYAARQAIWGIVASGTQGLRISAP